MIIKHKLKIDLVSQEVIPRLNAMHNDANSRVLEISLLESGTPWEIPTDVSAAVSYAKPDGTSGLYDTLPDGSTAYTISGNTVTIVLAPQVLTAPGLVRASIILIKNAVQLTTFPLSILVESIPGAGSEKSEDYYHYTTFDALNRAIGNLADLETENKGSLVAAINEITHGSGKGTVKTVNGLSPDENGNIEVVIDVDEAVNTALQQAKASGQFDGNDGYSIFLAHVTAGDATEITVNANDTITNGYSVKLRDLLLTNDGKVFSIQSFETSFGPGGKKDFYYIAELFSDIKGHDGASVGHSWYGTVLTITSASGTSSADLKGEKGDTGEQGIQGEKGDPGDKGETGEAGKTPVKGVDYFTETDKEEFLQSMEIFEEIGKTSVSNNLCDGVYEWGSLESSGNEGSLSPENYGFRTANFLPVEGGRKVLWSRDETVYDGTQLYCICEYDVNKNLVLRTKNINHCLNKWDTAKAFTLNANTKFVRFYIYNGETVVDLDAIRINLFYVENIADFWTGDGDDFIYVPHIIVESAGEFIPLTKIQSPLTGKKIVYDGDSICIGTYGGGGYAKIIADKVGGSFVNQAVGGARLVTKGSGSYHSIVDNLSNLPSDGDLYCFDGGVNDVWSSVPLGTYEMSNYTGEVDKTTICGAMETIFRYCLNNFVGKPVCYIITHKVSNINFENYKNYHDSAVAICNKYSIPYYDAYNASGLNGWNTAQNNAFLTGNNTGTPDGCHPNEEGYKRYYVPQLIQLFESMIP